jgi:hypothetical protein
VFFWLSGLRFQDLGFRTSISRPGFQDSDRCTQRIVRLSHLFPVIFLCVHRHFFFSRHVVYASSGQTHRQTPQDTLYIRLVCKPILQAKWSGFFAFGSISNFILVMLIILTNILITMFPSSAQWVPKFPMCSPRVRMRENSPPHLCLWTRERIHLPFALPSNHTSDKSSSQ